MLRCLYTFQNTTAQKEIFSLYGIFTYEIDASYNRLLEGARSQVTITLAF